MWSRIKALPARLGVSRPTVFWQVAGWLVGVQVATAILSVGLSAYFASARSAELIRGTLQLRLDAAAEEVEQRADFDAFGEMTLPERLRLDLPTRFPDPLIVLDHEGVPRDTFAASLDVPPAALDALDAGRIAVMMDDPEESWALAPILAPDGLPAAALLIRPLTRTLAEESRGTRTAFLRATAVTAALAALLALVLGAFATALLVRPLRRVTDRVERLGAGDYADRLPEAGDDEIGRLVRAINEMAGRVEASIETLQQTDRLRRDLIANVGHDLRTPLAALRGYLEEAERFAEEGRAGEIPEALASARRQAESAGALVADLFELSLLDSPQSTVPLRLGPVPLGELLNDVASSHAGAFRRDGIEFTTEIPTGLPVLDADGSRLVRLLSNVLDNARHHTPASGAVRLGASTFDDHVVVSIADTGEGIESAALDDIFERYYRGASARTRGTSGTGLGLAIALAIARAHGGDLTASSRLGHGSTFTLTLPLPADSSSVPA